MHVNEMAKSVYNPSVNFVDFKYLERPKKDGKYIFLIRSYLRPVIKRQIFFSTFTYTDLIYRVCCWKIQKLNTTETEKKIKKKKTKRKKKYNERTKLDNN